MPSVFKSCCSYLPQRWITVFLCFLGSFNAYAMRTSLSISITEMVIPPHVTTLTLDDTCPGSNETLGSINTTVNTQDKFAWSEYTQGVILSSFYWGYFITNILGGMIADKFGGKHTLGFSILSSAVLTILTPISVEWGGATAMIIIRVLMGIGEGPTFPSLNALLAKWIPSTERSWAASWAFSGGDFGLIVGMALSGVIIRYTGSWAAVNYFFGGIGVFSFLLHSVFIYSRPSDHPFISDSEAQYLEENLKHTSDHVPTTPWRYILRSKPVWALLILNFGQGFGFFAMISDMPKYMSNVLKYSIDDNGYLSAIAPMGSFTTCIVTSWFADRIIEKKLLSTVYVRKISSVFTNFVPGVFFVLTSYAGCDATLAVVLYCLGWSFSGFYNCCITCNSMDLGPNYAGTLLGFIFGMSTLTGFLAPYLVGVLTPNQTISEWRLAFWMCFVVFTFSTVVYLIFGSADVQEWNEPDYLNVKEKREDKEQIKEKVELLEIK